MGFLPRKQVVRTRMKPEKKRILVVDDDEGVRESLKKLLTESGHEVVLAQDGAMGAANIHDDDFDLVVLDLDLPKLCGFDLLDMLSAHSPTHPVIVLTGMLGDCEPGSLAGADIVLEKPPDVALFLAAVTTLLGSSTHTRMRQACNAPSGRNVRVKTLSTALVADELRATAAAIRNV